LEFNNSIDFTSGQINLDGIIDADIGMGESNGSSIVSGNVWDLLLANFLGDHFAELEFSLF